MKKNVKRALTAATGFVIGGAISYVVVNAAAEHRSVTDIYKPHDEPLHYAIDAGCAIVCAGVLTLLTSIGWKRSTTNHFGEPQHEPLLTQSPISEILTNEPPSGFQFKSPPPQSTDNPKFGSRNTLCHLKAA